MPIKEVKDLGDDAYNIFRPYCLLVFLTKPKDRRYNYRSIGNSKIHYCSSLSSNTSYTIWTEFN